MLYLLICVVSFLGSGLTLFSGFGLGTLLLPTFALFFPIDVSVALTAVVHLLNNLFKLSLLGKHADWHIALRFGVPAVLAAVVGAWLLGQLSGVLPIVSYTFCSKSFVVTPVKLTIGALLFIFALFELMPRLSRLQFSPQYLSLGGVLSGFFGGLSGNQGALRTAFLARAGLSKEAFIATGVVIACLTDISRLSIYASNWQKTGASVHGTLLAVATLSAFAGAYIGSRLLQKVTIQVVQYTVAAMLLIFALCLMLGF